MWLPKGVTSPYYVIATYLGPLHHTFANVAGLPESYSVVHDAKLKQLRFESTPTVAAYAAFANTITDITKRGVLDDADGDNISNLIEYGLAGNPYVANRQILPRICSHRNKCCFRIYAQRRF